MMTIRIVQTLAVLVAVVALIGCSTSPNQSSLKDSFAEQVRSVGTVTDFRRSGDELEFTAPDETGVEARWRVNIDAAEVQPQEDETFPFQGMVTSSWYANDELVSYDPGLVSALPKAFLDQGIAQECWALWEEASGRWDW